MNRIFVIMLLFSSCGNICDKNINKLISSQKASDIVEGYYIIGECKSDKYIKHIFDDIKDSRISHNINFYGISVYQSKIIALKKISGLIPPQEIRSEVDSTIINFYFYWAKKNKLIDSESDWH